jgi:Bifunctional DNA primase/polymerase, N-terminal
MPTNVTYCRWRHVRNVSKELLVERHEFTGFFVVALGKRNVARRRSLLLRRFGIWRRRRSAGRSRGVAEKDRADPLELLALELVAGGARAGETPMRCPTPSGGMHLYYAMRSGIRYGNAVRINGKAIDLRCEGAYIVCPWSKNADGVPYLWDGELIRANELPPLRVSWLRKRKPRRIVRPVVPGTSAENAAWRARGYLAHIEGAIAGMRGHDRTFRVACVLTIKFGLTLEQAWPLFLEWNQQCEPPWSEKELLHKLQDALKQRFHF